MPAAVPSVRVTINFEASGSRPISSKLFGKSVRVAYGANDSSTHTCACGLRFATAASKPSSSAWPKLSPVGLRGF